MLTQSRLRELLKYDPETGNFVRVVGVKGAAVGEIAGSRMANGYRAIRVDYQDFLVHRLAWFYTYGKWPEQYIDHINGNPSDNRLCNLREATQTQQNANSRRRKNNRSGFKGVSWCKTMNKWRAAICKNGDNTLLGYFDDAEQAHEIYILAAKRLFGNFARVA